MSWYTLQLAFPVYQIATVSVDADTLEEACRSAIQQAHDDDAWKASDHIGDTHVYAICEGAGTAPYTAAAQHLPIPEDFREDGTPPLVTIDPRSPHGTLEVTRGTVRIRFLEQAATVTVERSDNPPPPRNKPTVTITRRPDGAPDVDVRGGNAIVRIEGWPPRPVSNPST